MQGRDGVPPRRGYAPDPRMDERRRSGRGPIRAATLGGVARPASPPTRGWFITIEGPEGGGKTTQAARLEAWLRGVGMAVVRPREPGRATPGARPRPLPPTAPARPPPI